MYIAHLSDFFYFCTQIHKMNGKYIKILTALGLVAIVAIQSLWLVNTYRLIELQLLQTGNRLFPKTVIDEAIMRLKELKDEGSEVDVEAVRVFNWEESSNEQAMLDFITTTLHHYADSLYNSTVSLPLLDSLFTAVLANDGYHAKLVCQVVDSSGNILLGKENAKVKPSIRTVETKPVFINEEHTRAVQAIIVNPYWIAFQKMGMMLVATVLLILFVAGCIVYQVKIIIRQNKIARLRQDFTYAMIHDMKTPISTISMAGHTLESGILDNKPELRKQYFSILKEESSHLLNLSEKILTIAKSEQSRLKLVKSEVDLPKLFDELVKKFQVKAEKKVFFEIDCPPSLPSFLADEEYLKEAIGNLIDNSIKYSNEEVRIRLSAEAENGYVYIKVWDNGWGIPLKQQKRIFEKFERGGLEYRKEKKVSGFGLGLNYVYRVLTEMNGLVEVNSVEGIYSEFILSLPVEEEKA